MAARSRGWRNIRPSTVLVNTRSMSLKVDRALRDPGSPAGAFFVRGGLSAVRDKHRSPISALAGSIPDVARPPPLFRDHRRHPRNPPPSGAAPLPGQTGVPGLPADGRLLLFRGNIRGGCILHQRVLPDFYPFVLPGPAIGLPVILFALRHSIRSRLLAMAQVLLRIISSLSMTTC